MQPANSFSFDNKYEACLCDSIITIESLLYAPFPFGKCRWPYKGVFHDLLLWRLQTRSELIFFFSRRFGSFEEFKKRNVDASGNLTPHKKLLCGLGMFVIYIKVHFSNLLESHHWILLVFASMIFTARKHSFRMLCFYRCLSVHREGGV